MTTKMMRTGSTVGITHSAGDVEQERLERENREQLASDSDMSRSSKSLTPARLNDAILGCFGRLQPSDTLDHLVRYLGTWSGSELRITRLLIMES